MEEEQNTFYIADHCLLSIACSTNFRHPNLESTVCFVREGDEWNDSQRLMDKMVDYWDSVQNLAENHLLRVFAPLINEIDVKIAEEQQFEAAFLETVSLTQEEQDEIDEGFFDEVSEEEENDVEVGSEIKLD